MMWSVVVGGWLMLGSAQATPPPPSPAQPSGPQRTGALKSPAAPLPGSATEAYLQFLLGRHLDAEGDVAGAIKAYSEAARLDAGSAEIRAELSGLYARENKLREAIESADVALKLDADNVEAHRILGFIYAGVARVDDGAAALDADATGYAVMAITHLDAARTRAAVPEPGLDLLLGRLYLRTGASDKAIGLLTRLVADEPGRPEPVGLLVQAYERAGRADEAVALLEGTVDTQPQFHAALGGLYEQQRRWPLAAAAYDKAVARSPKNLALRTRLAAVLLSGGDESQAGRALALLDTVRQESPGDAHVLYLIAEAQRIVGRLDDSEATARALMTVAPGSLTGPYALALVLAQKQQHRAIVEALEPVVDGVPARGAVAGSEASMLHVRLGLAYAELGEFDRALAAFERARAASAVSPAIDVYVIQTQLAARRIPAAIELARKALAARPGDPHVVRLLAGALRRAGQAEEGARLLSDALASNPGDVSAHLALAEFHARSQQYAAAIRVLQEAAAKFPSELDVPFQMGSVLERQKRYADAERKFREVLSGDPLHAPALNYLGYMLAERGQRLDESIGYIKRALKAEPYNGAYLDSLGWAYFRQNRLDLAEINLRKAAEQRVCDSAVQDHFGDLMFRLGRFAEAAAAWQRAVDGDTADVDGAEIARKLRSARDKARKR